MKVLITAGPTYEYIDRVRYLSNASSGKMGYELAYAARDKGHNVVLVSGPTNLKAPAGIKLIKVISAKEMYEVTTKLFANTDVLIMAAAVSDYRPSSYFNGKLKKQNKNLILKLVPTIDILKTLGNKKGNRILIGFALEAEARFLASQPVRKNIHPVRNDSSGGNKDRQSRRTLVVNISNGAGRDKDINGKPRSHYENFLTGQVKNSRENAIKKLHQKNLDYVVLNSPDAFGKDVSTAEIWSKKGLIKRFVNTSKRQISRFIIRLVKVDK